MVIITDSNWRRDKNVIKIVAQSDMIDCNMDLLTLAVTLKKFQKLFKECREVHASI